MNRGIHLRMAAALSNDWGPLLSDTVATPYAHLTEITSNRSRRTRQESDLWGGNEDWQWAP